MAAPGPWLLLAAAAVPACGPPAGSPAAGTGAPAVRVRFLSGEAGCGLPGHDPALPGRPPPDAARVVVEVLDAAGAVVGTAEAPVDPASLCADGQGREFACPFVTADDRRARQLVLADLPSDADLVVRVRVLDGAGIVRWSGRRAGVRVEAQGQAALQVTLTRHGASTCVGLLAKARAFGTATALPDGRVLLAGGASQIAECGPRCVDLAASADADLYDPASGLVVAVAGGMSTPRALHSAVALADGRVAVVGGVGRATLDLSEDAVAPWLFDEPDAHAGPRATYEVFDPATGRFGAPGGLRTARIEPALAVLGGDVVIATGGGIAPGDGPAPTAEGLQSSDLLALGEPSDPPPDGTAGPAPRSARRGAALVRRGGDDAGGAWLLAGGAGDSDRAVELLDGAAYALPADGGWTAHRAADVPNLYRPVAAPLAADRLLVTGGVAPAPLPFERRWGLEWLDADAVVVLAAADGAVTRPAWQGAARLLHAGASLGAGGALVAGGIVRTADGLDVTDTTLRVDAGGLPGIGPPLAQARAGHAAAALSDGTVLVAGGFTLPTEERLPLLRDTVEVLNPGDAR